MMTKAEAGRVCDRVVAVLRDHGIRGPAHDNAGDERAYARQLVGYLWLSEDDADLLTPLADALEERLAVQGEADVALATQCACQIWAAWCDVRLGKPRLEQFATGIAAGMNPDEAARRAGGTGRPR